MITKKFIIEWGLVTIGVIIMSLGFYFFLSPTKIVAGGVTGLSIVFESLIPRFPRGLFILIANVLCAIIAFIFLGKDFFFKTVYATILSPGLITLLDLVISDDIVFKQLGTNGYLLSAIFGGIFVGLGLGIVLRQNASTGGMDVIQKILHRYLNIPFSVALYISDGITVLLAMIFIKSELSGMEIGLYGILSMITTGIVIDKLLIIGRHGYTAFIITSNGTAIKEEIYIKANRGITIIRAEGGFTSEDKELLICTLSASQTHIIKNIIEIIDPQAFSFIIKTNEIIGRGFINEKPDKEISSADESKN